MIEGKLAIESKRLKFQTKGEEIDLIDITFQIQSFVTETKIKEGRITVFVPGSTGAIIATEYEPRLNQDTKRVIKELIQIGDNYQHDKIDNNAHSHLRTTLFGSEMTIPVINGTITTGTWQQICFADFDTRPRNRTIILQMLGISPN